MTEEQSIDNNPKLLDMNTADLVNVVGDIISDDDYGDKKMLSLVNEITNEYQSDAGFEPELARNSALGSVDTVLAIYDAMRSQKIGYDDAIDYVNDHKEIIGENREKFRRDFDYNPDEE